ncbi:MAG TPA: family 16 glycosylhydrolase [Patescibacteria group bacterium]|nr:family 16 glycosylhydrolase [Patescibacteria group bacterium]
MFYRHKPNASSDWMFTVPNILKRIKKHPFSPEQLSITIAVVSFAGIGFYFTLFSSAASPVSVEPENGVVTSPAVVINDSTASGGKMVKFVASNNGNLPAPTWSDEFSDPLSFATDAGGGTWRTKGYEAGGSLNDGYSDFAASNWDAPRSVLEQYGLAYTSNGVLSLKAMRNKDNLGDHNKWIGPYLVSNDMANLTWRYGYFEWRMANPNPVRGMFPTLWLFSNLKSSSAGYEGAEMDMIEIFGSRTGSPWYSGVHFNPSHLNGKEGQNVATMNSDTSGWHRYAIDWTPDRITYSRDGTEIGSLTGAEAAWFQHANLGIRMNYTMDPKFQAGTGNFSTDNDPAPGTMPTMQVDYVRYYVQKPANLPGGSDDPY